LIAIHDLVAAARERLRQAGLSSDEAEIDARLLAEHLLGWDAARYFSAGAEARPEGFEVRYEALVARRAAREPLAYITGHQEFWGLDLVVSPAVMVPRPESELIVEAALEILAPRTAEASPDEEAARSVVADVCTGSGCLAIAIARERPGAQIAAGDVSGDALGIAAANAARHGVSARIRFVRSDLLDTSGVPGGAFDLIVSNPPYVPDGDRALLPPEVRDYEPPLALFAGADGLDVIRRLVAQAPSRLKRGGALVFELGFGQADAVAQLISATSGLKMIAIRPDLQGIPRTAVALRL